MDKSNLGLIQVYTGNGKGKTTAALGLALRACGHGFRVCMLQFMKDDPTYGEMIAQKYLPKFKIIPVGRNEFVNLNQPDQVDIELALKGWQMAQEMMASDHYDIVILDEINIAMHYGLVDTQNVVRFLQEVPRKCEVILTGRYAPDAIIELADLVTVMQEVKHPFQQGVSSRDGIEH